MKNLFKLCSLLIAAGFLFASCEGPMGPAGKDGQNGADGADGKDANETCKECHSPEVVDKIAVQFELSKHSYGEAAFEEAGNTACAVCHTSEAFKYVCANNTPSTFVMQSNGDYKNMYQTTADKAYGDISCFTCHSKLHTTYKGTDFSPLTNTAAVSMTMWAGRADKTINIAKEGGMGNLCVKCHQPRPLTTSTTLTDGRVVDYDSLKNFPALVFYDKLVGNKHPNKVIPSYRTHVHYGTVSAIFAGIGGIEFQGDAQYENSPHASEASCIDCHMVEPDAINGRAGGHTFRVRNGEGRVTSQTAWNFNGCNTAECHNGAMSASSTDWTETRADVKALLDQLAAKINEVGGATPILHSDPDVEANLWASLTTGDWDGYLNIYDPASNPGGAWKNPGSTSSFTPEQKVINDALPVFPSLTNGVMGALINFQMCLREFSLGIHNTKYTKALLNNTLQTLNAPV
jgi:hypothetical protein